MDWILNKRGGRLSALFITGANRGIGFEFARQYAADGWDVIACCRKPEKADTLQALAHTNPAVRIEKLDVTDDENSAALAEKLKDTPIDLLINAAGIFSGAGPGINAMSGDESQVFGSVDSAAWAKVLRTNAIAPVMIAQAFLKNLIKGKGRKLIMISSHMGSIADMHREDDIAYRTSKTALNAAMKSISLSLRGERIVVASFHPGWVKTDMGGIGASLTPEFSVTHMRRLIANLTSENSGQFINYDGKILPW
jgi:NAD(P)-dependent dehydrogenase (short-subunit alcohol dehydrogenase family)